MSNEANILQVLSGRRLLQSALAAALHACDEGKWTAAADALNAAARHYREAGKPNKSHTYRELSHRLVHRLKEPGEVSEEE